METPHTDWRSRELLYKPVSDQVLLSASSWPLLQFLSMALPTFVRKTQGSKYNVGIHILSDVPCSSQDNLEWLATTQAQLTLKISDWLNCFTMTKVHWTLSRIDIRKHRFAGMKHYSISLQIH